METDKRIENLAKHLECSVDSITVTGDPVIFEHGASSYLVLTDEEADEAVAEEIENSLWAFNAEFIASHTKHGLNDRAIGALKLAQGELCEDANDLVASMIESMPDFVADAVSSDGRGHFLSRYDGEEYEVNGFYVYRMD